MDRQDAEYIEHMILLMEQFNSAGDKLNSGAGQFDKRLSRMSGLS